MSQQNRYSDRTRLTGRLSVEARDVMAACFASHDEAKDFVETKLGKDVLNSINWNKALKFSCLELVDRQTSNGRLGALFVKLQESKPDNKELSELVDYLVAAGYLNDSQAPAPVSNRRSDWVSLYPTDRVGFDGPNRAIIVDVIAESVRTVAALDRLLGDSFGDEHSKTIRNDLERHLPIKINVDRVMAGFENLRRMNAFLLAVQDTDQSNVMLMYTAASIVQEFRPKPVVPAASAPTDAAATTQTTTNAAPKEFRVTGVLTTLTAEQVGLVSRMITSCFDSHGMASLCHHYTRERIEHIVATGPLRKMAEDLVRWCEEQRDKLVPLFNGMVKERPGRPEVKELFRNLAAAGAIEIEE